MEELKKTMHVHVSKGMIGDYVILVEGPEQARTLAQRLENARQVAYYREYLTFTGTLEGTNVSVSSVGVGGPSVAIGIEELVECGAKTILKVGGCDSVCGKVHRGDLIIPNAAVRMEGVSLQYTLVEYPAVPDMDVVRAIEEAAVQSGHKFHIGVDITRANHCILADFAAGKVSEPLMRWKSYVDAKALSSELDAAVAFIVCECLKVRCGAIMVSASDQGKPVETIEADTEELMPRAYDVAIEALRHLIKADKADD